MFPFLGDLASPVSEAGCLGHVSSPSTCSELVLKVRKGDFGEVIQVSLGAAPLGALESYDECTQPVSRKVPLEE